tara:strand:- start:525 stop:1226 length:702 start_codon:yes stop_codon:yes gene_type:complete
MNIKTKLTVIVPCFNEINTITKIIKLIRKQKLNLQLIVVDDFSRDGTREKLKKFIKTSEKLILHKKNLGKGAAIRTAKKYIKGKIVIIQDADLEYSPNDYAKLIKPILMKKTNIVYGSRVLNKDRYFGNSFSSEFRVFANHVLTIISNLINNQNLTDAHTCYKVIKTDIFNKIKLNENGFSFCPEITTKISLKNEKIIEVPISYKGRSYDEGKKINFYDGFNALKTLIKYRFF